MNETTIWLGIVIGLILITGLCRFIYIKHCELKTHQNLLKEQNDHQVEQKEYLVNSIKVIATAMLEDQVELSEGCIRVKVLIDHLDASLHEQEVFKIFEEMYRKTEHMPTHQARKNVDKNFIHKLDQQRFALEKQHRDSIRKAAGELLEVLA